MPTKRERKAKRKVRDQSERLKEARRIKALIDNEFAAMKRCEFGLVDVLRSPGSFEMRRCDIWVVLQRAPKLGQKGAKRVLLRARVWPHDRLEDLTLTQLEDILAELPARSR